MHLNWLFILDTTRIDPWILVHLDCSTCGIISGNPRAWRNVVRCCFIWCANDASAWPNLEKLHLIRVAGSIINVDLPGVLCLTDGNNCMPYEQSIKSTASPSKSLFYCYCRSMPLAKIMSQSDADELRACPLVLGVASNHMYFYPTSFAWWYLRSMVMVLKVDDDFEYNIGFSSGVLPSHKSEVRHKYGLGRWSIDKLSCHACTLI